MSSNENFTNMPPRKKPADDSSFAELKRRFHSNPFVFTGTIIVLVIVTVAFVLVPAIVPSAGGLGAGKLTFGYYNGEPVVYAANNYFVQQRQWYSHQARNYGWDEYLIWNAAYRDFVLRTAIFDVMKKAAYEPPEKLVNKKMTELPQFLDDNGKFSRFLFNQYPATDRLALRGEVKNSLTLERFMNDITNIRSSEAETAFIGAMAKQQRSFKIAALPYDSYPDEELAAFAEKHADLFVSLHLSQISASKEKDARKIAQSIKDGTVMFEDAARNQSKDEYAERGGDAGARLAHELNAIVTGEEDRAALAALAKGAVSEPVKTADGWVIFRAEEDAKPADLKDALELSRVRAYITNNERGLIEDYLLAKAALAAEGARTAAAFEQAAKDAGAVVSEAGPLPVNYGNLPLFSALSSFGGIEAFRPSYTDPKSGAAFDENFWKTAFSTPLLTASKPVVLSARQQYVALMFPSEENTEDSAAAENSQSAFSGWALEAVSKSIDQTVFSSQKFEDQFDSAFQYLFPDQFYQHSITTFGF